MKIAGWLTLIALIIGTGGLLINEFVFHWGRTATVTFAVFSVIGLVILASSILRMRTSHRGGNPNE